MRAHAASVFEHAWQWHARPVTVGFRRAQLHKSYMQPPRLSTRGCSGVALNLVSRVVRDDCRVQLAVENDFGWRGRSEREAALATSAAIGAGLTQMQPATRHVYRAHTCVHASQSAGHGTEQGASHGTGWDAGCWARNGMLVDTGGVRRQPHRTVRKARHTDGRSARARVSVRARANHLCASMHARTEYASRSARSGHERRVCQLRQV